MLCLGKLKACVVGGIGVFGILFLSEGINQGDKVSRVVVL